MTSTPAISVLMSVYNEREDYLRKSIESILNQSYHDFEFIIILDGSTNGSKEVCEEYASTDKRIRLIENETNIGLTRSLNKGLGICTGTYIARMDSDDISHTKRLEEQFDYMEIHTNTILCGTKATFIDNHGKEIKKHEIKASSNFIIKLLHPLLNMFYHPAFFIRRSMIEKYNIRYNPLYRYSQDYDFSLQCLRYGEMYNIDHKLLHYRVNLQGISSTKLWTQLLLEAKIKRRFITYSPKNSIYVVHFLLTIFFLLPIRYILGNIQNH